MKWWYENEEEEMKLYKNEDLCIECKNEFFSKPYDHRDPTPGQLGYCIKCDNLLIKEKKMEFDKSRVYTALNADELKQGDKVITARCMADLKTWVEADAEPNIIELIQDETNTDRFTCKCHGSNKTYDCPLAYLVERKENCTNCGAIYTCAFQVREHPELEKCKNWKPKTEPKTEPHYRPFRDTDELIKVWNKKFYLDFKPTHDPLTMPLIWVRQKGDATDRGHLIVSFSNNGCSVIDVDDIRVMLWEMLFGEWEFLDGTPCGVEE